MLPLVDRSRPAARCAAKSTAQSLNVDADSSDPIEVPFAELTSAALRGVIESFVLREGTEYGERDHSLDEKVAQVMAQLERGEARILFEPESGAVELVLVHRLGRSGTQPNRDPGDS